MEGKKGTSLSNVAQKGAVLKKGTDRKGTNNIDLSQVCSVHLGLHCGRVVSPVSLQQAVPKFVYWPFSGQKLKLLSGTLQTLNC